MALGDPHLLIATGVMGAMLLGSIVMMADMALHPHCRECYHCRKKETERQARAAEERHKNYHYWTDRRHWACQDKDCPGLKGRR